MSLWVRPWLLCAAAAAAWDGGWDGAWGRLPQPAQVTAGVFSEPWLDAIEAEADALYRAMEEGASTLHGHRNWWMPAGQAPRTAIEHAVQHLRRFSGAPDDYGAEWWVKSTRYNPFHFDLDESRAELRHPRNATVTYLRSEGAPTAVLRQRAPADGDRARAEPADPRMGLLVFPERNAHLVFDPALYHGVPRMAEAMSGERLTLLVNWWPEKPLAPGNTPLDGALAARARRARGRPLPLGTPMEGARPTARAFQPLDVAAAPAEALRPVPLPAAGGPLRSVLLPRALPRGNYVVRWAPHQASSCVWQAPLPAHADGPPAAIVLAASQLELPAVIAEARAACAAFPHVRFAVLPREALGTHEEDVPAMAWARLGQDLEQRVPPPVSAARLRQAAALLTAAVEGQMAPFWAMEGVRGLSASGGAGGAGAGGGASGAPGPSVDEDY